MKLVLVRISDYGDVTTGILMFEHSPVKALGTIEPAWNNNIPGKSCIPSGKYSVVRTVSSKFGHTFEVKHVPGRSDILFHSGNIASDTSGCILLGLGFIETHDAKVFLNESKKAFKMFWERLRGVDCLGLHIINAWDRDPLI